MITEDYISSETAKLLKERGFESDDCHTAYDENGEFFFHGDYSKDRHGIVDAPTHQMAIKWLRKAHNILIVVDYEWECDTTPYYFKIYRLGENGKPERVPVKGVSYDKDDNPTEHIIGYRDWERSNNDYKKYEEACEDAIQYCLKNIISNK